MFTDIVLFRLMQYFQFFGVNVLPDLTRHLSTGVSVPSQNLTQGVKDPPKSVLVLLSA